MRCHNYIFFDIEPSIHNVSAADLMWAHAQFIVSYETDSASIDEALEMI